MTEATLSITDPNELLKLFGPRDQHLRKLQASCFDVTITQRNGRDAHRRANDEEVERATRTLQRLRHLSRKKREFDPRVEDVATAAGEEGARDPGAAPQVVSKSEDHRHSTCRSSDSSLASKLVRRRYVDAIRESRFDVCDRTGRVRKNLSWRLRPRSRRSRREQIRKIVLVRPAVEAGESLGFLPGDLARPNSIPYLRPLLDALGEK